MLGSALAVAALAVAAPAALSAAAGRYTGKTNQGQAVTFRLGGGALNQFTIVVEDTCPDGHILRVTEHYPRLAIKKGRFGGSFVPAGGHAGEHSKLGGRVFKRQIIGNLTDTSFSRREGALCHGSTHFSARHV
jgi:hypothetical protein